ncbi:MAG: putative rane protein [Bacteroidetes bacterium]|nr:putative rane protein [Bacteroidota bacterium]
MNDTNTNNRPLKQKQFYWNVLLIIILCCVSLSDVSAQQEPMYSQYMFNLLQINPAYAGSRALDNITALYRNQWMGLKGAPKTASVSWDRRADQSNVGYGLEIYSDRLGIEKTSGLQAFYSYHIPFEESYLAFGVSGGVLNYRADYFESNTYTPDDPMFQSNINGWLPTAGFGVLFATQHWYVGLSVPALLRTKIDVQNSLSQTNLGANNHYFLTGGYSFQLNETTKLKPSMMVKATKGSSVQCDFNTICWFNDMWGIGLSYRTEDALVGLVEFQITTQLRIGYSYDYTLSDFAGYNRGTHELMLRIEIPNKNCFHCQSSKD